MQFVFNFPVGNQKRLRLPFKRRRRCHTLRDTTLLAAPSRDTAPQRPPIRAGGITPATRPYLLASSFSRRLQGDFRRHSRPPRTETAALLAGPCAATRPYQRPNVQLPPMIPRFDRLSTGKTANFPMGPHPFLCRASRASSRQADFVFLHQYHLPPLL